MNLHAPPETMAPLALYIEQVQSDQSASATPRVTVYPPSPPNNPIFDSLHSAPFLSKKRTNHILVYPGSFNPPHRGHLHLLKHAFTRGTHDMNVIAAIIHPRSDESLSRKVKAENGKFMFGRRERCLLWKQDICFPPWAWVYENSGASLTQFSKQLIRATEKDGYALEFVPLYGAEGASPSSPPSRGYDCKTIILSDAARAADYQCSSGRLIDFEGYTKWRAVRIDGDLLLCTMRAKARRALKAKQDFPIEEASDMPRDDPSCIGKVSETVVVKTTKDFKGVLICKQRHLPEGQALTLRFLKCDDVDPREVYNDISSTILRDAMHKKTGVKLKEALDWMALSSDILWRCKYFWIKKARKGTGGCVSFNISIEEMHLSRPPTVYEMPPWVEKCELAEPSKARSASEPAPSLEDPTSQDPETTPSFEQPRSPEESRLGENPPETNSKKRLFSATGLGDEAEVLSDPGPVGGAILAEEPPWYDFW